MTKTNPLSRRPLEGKVALVTGASRGIGRGIALQLGEAGATVYITGRAPNSTQSQQLFGNDNKLRSLEQTAKEIVERGGKAHAVYCDHSNSEDVGRLFQRIEEEQGGRLDILVNNAFAAHSHLNLVSSTGKKFWEYEPTAWDEVNEVGLRNVYFCSTLAARLMVLRGDGLIVNISSFGGLQYMFSVAYGVGKAAVDRMAVDMGIDLKPHNVTSVSLWPGVVQTEYVGNMENAERIANFIGMSKSAFEQTVQAAETPEFVGKAVVALAQDPKRIRQTGRIHFTADLAAVYGFTEPNGVVPANPRSMRVALNMSGWHRLSNWIPAFLKVPKSALHYGSYKF